MKPFNPPKEDKVKKFLVFDIGCIECDEDSQPVGIFDTMADAKKTIDKYITNEPNKFGSNWGRKEWNGQHSVEIFEVEL
jgi:hypothetical protein